MPSLHLIERQDYIKRVADGSGEWESGYWAVSKDTAERLVGGDIYLHKAQDKPSHFGGKIVSYRIHQGGEYDGRIVFRFRASMEHKGVRTGPEKWGNEKRSFRHYCGLVVRYRAWSSRRACDGKLVGRISET